MTQQNKLICSREAFEQYSTPKHLTPDYFFLPSSNSDSYYSRKYGSNHSTGSISSHNIPNTITGIKPIYQSKSSKISRYASVMLLSLSFLATALEVKARPNTEWHRQVNHKTRDFYKFYALQAS